MKLKSSPSEGIYRRVSVRMYGDAKFMRLSRLQPSGQALWIYLLTGPHTGPIPGVFVIGKAALAEALDWPAEDFDKAFAEVFEEGLLEFDAKTRMWFIPKAIRHNMPPNPNVVRSWITQWGLLPECDLRARIADHLERTLFSLSEPFGTAFQEVCGKALPKTSAKTSWKSSEKPSPKALAKQEQEQEQEAGTGGEEKTSSSLSAKPTVPCPYNSILDLYHERLPTLPRVKLKTAARDKALRKMWGWVLSSSKADGSRRASTAEEALRWFGEYFARAANNDFLMGRARREGPHANWKCDFDFLLTDRGMKHVIEKTEAEVAA